GRTLGALLELPVILVFELQLVAGLAEGADRGLDLQRALDHVEVLPPALVGHQRADDELLEGNGFGALDGLLGDRVRELDVVRNGNRVHCGGLPSLEEATRIAEAEREVKRLRTGFSQLRPWC